ncbi:CsbD family protein [Streptomyces sp. TLI_235]|uniref:CsbD family protein n=1 Tax=Kitasatospora sp. NPDC085879 TaxID=3154769 RepID=UPI000BDCA5E2|nr:CsbD family protein [Streptomyces sp. TLI_235]PBC69980.1 CsbD-like protein [Streptomyces sp. TLI_235]
MEISHDKKAAHKAEEVKGRVKKTAGAATGNRSLEAEGRADASQHLARRVGPGGIWVS